MTTNAHTTTPVHSIAIEWITRDEIDNRIAAGAQVLQNRSWPCAQHHQTWAELVAALQHRSWRGADVYTLERLRADVVTNGIRITGAEHCHASERVIPVIDGVVVDMSPGAWADIMAAAWASSGEPYCFKDHYDEVEVVYGGPLQGHAVCARDGDTIVNVFVAPLQDEPGRGVAVCVRRAFGANQAPAETFAFDYSQESPFSEAVRQERWPAVARLALAEWKATGSAAPSRSE